MMNIEIDIGSRSTNALRVHKGNYHKKKYFSVVTHNDIILARNDALTLKRVAYEMEFLYYFTNKLQLSL